jgi:uncharacterized membrane protein (DUF4010 family)
MEEALSQIFSPFFKSLVTSTAIGLIIGLEREFNSTEKEPYAGIRTFPITAILGCVMALLGQTMPWVLVAAVLGVFIFIAVSFYVTNEKGGITTEMALLVTFGLGIMAGMALYKEALATVAVTTTLLSLKNKLKFYIKQITDEELFAFVKFIILALFIIPILPNMPLEPYNFLNLFDIGIVVLVVLTLNFVSYMLMRFLSADTGIILTALLGGLYSSTAITWLFSSKSKENETLSESYAIGIILANTLVFLRVTFLTVLFNRNLVFTLLVPAVLMALVGGLYAYYLFRQKKENNNVPSEKIDLGSPLNILSALGFGLLYLGVGLMLFYSNQWLGSGGIYLTGVVGGLADVDAMTISISKFQNISVQVAVNVIIVATTVNTIVKLIIAILRGAKTLRRTVFFGMGSMICIGLAYLGLMLVF